MNLIPKRFHSFFSNNSALSYITVLGLFFLLASCSTKGPNSPINPYPEQIAKPESSKDKDWDFDYRKDRLHPKEKNRETAEDLVQGLETFTDPKPLADLKGFTDDLDPRLA